jgi:carbamoyl-phosphate synthase small subunit
MSQAILVLEDGRTFHGSSYGAEGRTLGEVVFATGMTGYQETLTDPSYAGQIVVQTAPHIGNTGVNSRDEESSRIWVEGYVVRDPSRMVSNFRSENTLPDELKKFGVVGISGIDTRALTRHLRTAGSMRGGVFSGVAAARPIDELISEVRTSTKMKGLSLSDTVTTASPYTVPAENEKVGRVAIVDLGIKRSTIDHMTARGLEVLVFPAKVDAETIIAANPDAVFYSNGPGDPEAAGEQVAVLRQILQRKIPFFGICFGNQLLGRALGFDTYKLPFGHRGINQPVLDRKTGKVEVTAHNHGFAVKVDGGPDVQSPAGFGRVTVSHISLNDDCVEGLECLDIPAFSVQYHPEAAAGPHDSNYLFDRLVELINNSKAAK